LLDAKILEFQNRRKSGGVIGGTEEERAEHAEKPTVNGFYTAA
jgi:hypothetical protein